MSNLKLIFTLIFIVSFTACSTRSREGVETDYNANPITVTVPRKLETKQVQAIIEHAFEKRGWSIVDSSTDSVTATLNHRGFNAKVVAAITGHQVRLLDYSTDSDGKKLTPLGWIKNLEIDLDKDFQMMIQMIQER